MLSHVPGASSGMGGYSALDVRFSTIGGLRRVPALFFGETVSSEQNGNTKYETIIKKSGIRC